MAASVLASNGTFRRGTVGNPSGMGGGGGRDEGGRHRKTAVVAVGEMCTRTLVCLSVGQYGLYTNQHNSNSSTTLRVLPHMKTETSTLLAASFTWIVIINARSWLGVYNPQHTLYYTTPSAPEHRCCIEKGNRGKMPRRERDREKERAR